MMHACSGHMYSTKPARGHGTPYMFVGAEHVHDIAIEASIGHKAIKQNSVVG